MKRQHLITFILTAFFVMISLHGIHTYASVSGDDLCGNPNPCPIGSYKLAINNFLPPLTSIAITVFILFASIRIIFAYKQKVEGNNRAMLEAYKSLAQGLLGLLVILAVFGGPLAKLFQMFGVDPKYLQLISDAFFTHAYAGDTLPNPTGITNLYDFIFVAFKLAVSFFVYPAIVGMWVWSGFSYVYAQGKPEAIKKAHQWLLWAVISTIVIFSLQGLLTALQGTAKQITSGTTQAK